MIIPNGELMERFAVMVVGAINNVLMGYEDGCCADCCHPCSVLRDMIEDGSLDALISEHAPAQHLVYDWWKVPQYEQDIRQGHVDTALFAALWRCGSRPQCTEPSARFPQLHPPEWRPEPHIYLSTGCHHGFHTYCASPEGVAGIKNPARCKFCEAACICGCHYDAPPPTVEPS
jgi:hypothetical protein